ETLVLRVPPDVQLADWNAGRFTLTQSATETDGRQVLTLHGPGDDDPPPDAGKPKGKPAPPSRPRARLRVQEPEFHTRQHAWWQVGAADQTLTAHIAYQVTQGKLYRLLVQTPAWAVEAVELSARVDGRDLGTVDLVRGWTVQGDANTATLVVDLHRGLGPSAPAHLTVRLRHTPARGAGLPPTLAFPALTVRGARFQEGALAISVAAAHQATAAASEPEAAPESAEPESAGGRDLPWGRELPDFLYVSRGPPVTGVLTLRPRRAQVRARCRSQVLVAAGRVTAVLEVQAQPLAGNPQALDLWLSAPAVPDVWHTVAGANSVRR